MLSRLGGKAFEVIEVLLVVNSRSVVLHCLPRDEETVEIEAPALEAREMLVGLLDREGPAHEGDALPVVEAFLEARIAVGTGRHLAIAAEVGPAEHEAPPLPINPMIADYRHEPTPFDFHSSPRRKNGKDRALAIESFQIRAEKGRYIETEDTWSKAARKPRSRS